MFFDEMRDIFEVVVGQEEYQREGMIFPHNPLVGIPLSGNPDLQKSIRRLRQEYGISEDKKIPGACVLSVSFESSAELDTMLHEMDWFRWEDLIAFYRDVLQPWIERPPVEGRHTEIYVLMEASIVTIAPLPRKRRKFGGVPSSRAQTLLWAHHLGHPVPDRIELVWGEQHGRNVQKGLEFSNGAVRLVPYSAATSSSLDEGFPFYPS
jgi:hypothetical protein